MKIIRLSTFLDFGGVESRLANISHIKDENEWIFVCLNHAGKAAMQIQSNGKRVINLSTSSNIYSFATFFKVYQIFRKEKPDIVHTSGAEANFHGILAARFAGVKTIIGEEIGIPKHSAKGRFIFSKVYKYANYVVGNSKPVLEAVHQQDSVPNRKLVQIANPVIFRNITNHTIGEKKSDTFNILTVSRLEPVKNLESVIRVLAKLKDNLSNKILLTIAGSGSSENGLKNLVKELKLESEVCFLGMIEDPYIHFKNADLYILNSFTEGFSNSLAEAMYSKTPSLSTTVGAATEIIQDGVNGFLVPPDNDLALHEKLKQIIEIKEEKRNEIGEKGHQMIVENFSLEKHREKLMEIYKK